MKNISFLIFFMLLWASCKNDLPPSIPQPPAPPVEEVEVFAPCNLSESGEASAIKISAEWKATAKCRKGNVPGDKYWIIEFFTCSEYNEFREYLFFSGIPDSNPVYHYKLHSDAYVLKVGTVFSNYVRVTSDGDVLDDYYNLDTTALDNYFIIDTWDTINKQVEGRFRVSYVVRQPQINPDNPEKVKFWKGTFKLPLRD